ncbi:hypothetical protein ENUP19_0298G0047 [Entamoeba nuttalli]
MQFGAIGLSIKMNIFTMCCCFVFGINYLLLYAAFTHSDIGKSISIISFVDGIGGIITLIILLILSYLPCAKINYKIFGIFTLATNFILTSICTVSSSINMLSPIINKTYLYLIVEIFNSSLPPSNFFVFFNLSYSLSSQHTTFYITGCSFGTFLACILGYAEISEFVAFSIVTLFSLVGLILVIILFIFTPQIYDFLKCQERILYQEEYIGLDDPLPKYNVVRIFKTTIKEMRHSLITIFCCYYIAIYLVPRFINPVQRYFNCYNDNMDYDENNYYYQLIQLVGLLYYAGDVIGRFVEIFAKPHIKVVLISSVINVLIATITILPVYFCTAGNISHATIAEKVMLGYAPLLGLVNGFIVSCAIEYSISQVEPRLAVALVLLFLYLGIFAGDISQLLTSGLDLYLSSSQKDCSPTFV